jgi:methylase of polypeptide subunit release factors
LRDIFGWNRPFDPVEIDTVILDLLRQAEAIEESSGALRSRVRVAALGNHLFLHSSYPTTAPDSVFFGPDTYRFCNFLAAELTAMASPKWIVDMGAGSGAGGILAAGCAGDPRLTLVDINPAAARVAQINARFARVDAEIVVGDRIPEGCDLVIANPPYMIDGDHRSYRDGGGLFGGEVALSWARQAIAALAPGGALLLYTGAAFVEGEAPLLEELRSLSGDTGADLTTREIDPDVFGDELARPDYARVDRIAAVGIRMMKSRHR